MTGGSRPSVLEVVADDGMMASGKAVSLGLIVTELVINALKYAFRTARPDARLSQAEPPDRFAGLDRPHRR